MLAILRGCLAFTGYLLNTLFWGPWVISLGVIKLLPIKPLRQCCTYLIDGIATTWIAINNLNQRLLSGTKLVVNQLPELSPQQWYLVIANHQSWVDILLLQNLFNRRIPILKFFLKQQLLYVPVIGLAWWALDFPFMKRYSKSTLARKPHLKGQDQQATRDACAKFQLKPVAIMNFVEGTRFTPAKAAAQQGKFANLLTPKAGGIALALTAMDGKLQQLLDVTIHYPDGIPSFWQFLCGEVGQVNVDVCQRSLAEVNQLDYHDNSDRVEFQRWLNQLWQRKAETLQRLQHSPLPSEATDGCCPSSLGR
ncbi:acyltransferase [Ferrimonas senticii]|uniref:acyltransferase n=1 Tax=Ferrimonas senticii TaxID=394566 RepID=UPI000401ECFF|nr:acyltransferase [Ferrimonas senticii]